VENIKFEQLLDYYNSLPKCNTRDKVKARINELIGLDSTVVTIDEIKPYLRFSRLLNRVFKIHRKQVPNWVPLDTIKELIKLGEQIEEEK